MISATSVARRTMERLWIWALMLIFGTAGACAPESPLGEDSSAGETAVTGILEQGPYDVVLARGRVMDPESGTDGTFNVGITGGRVVAISAEELEGAAELDVSGLVVAPGFIDLHAHGQDPVSARLQAQDGVTTQLDLEIGAFPVSTLIAEREGKAIINFGASASHLGARMAFYDDEAVGHVAGRPSGARSSSSEMRYAYTESTPDDTERILALLDDGLDDGGLGIGMGIVYTPAASREEIYRVFERAAERDVPIFVHMIGTSGPLGDVQEMLANAATTGAALHIVHINSSTDEMAPVAIEMIRAARERGLDVTTEAYPYTAGSTRIESALFDSWDDRSEEDYQTLEWPATGERLTRVTFEQYRKQGGWVIIHSREEETNAWITAQPDVVVASDGIPFAHGPAHPRGSGTYSRVLGRYVRDQAKLSLMEGLAKMTIQPARRLEAFSPQMARKGRVSLGADADLVVFDPETIIDRSTYAQGDRPSAGIVHVLVEGTFVVREGEVQDDVFPGRAIVSDLSGAESAP